MKEETVIDAINAGAQTSDEIAEFAEVSPSTARRYLKKLHDDPESDVTRESHPSGGYVYGLEAATLEADEMEMPVFGDREYSWGELVPPPDDAEYVETNGELTKLNAIIDNRHETDQLPRSRWKGPPGTGKTTAARSIAAERGWPVITVQFTASMRDSQLIGSPHIIGGESVWVDGPLVKALLCSQERPVVVILDEINRAPFHRKSSLQPFLDHRAQVTIPLRGGETIQGEAENITTVATMNEGSQYETFDIDPAERRRHGVTFEIPYLGLQNARREATLITESTPVERDFARVLVRAANQVREIALEDPTSVIDTGLATSTLLDWARTTVSYRLADYPNPIEEAIDDAVVMPHYTDEREADEVRAVLLDELLEAHATMGD